MEALGAVLAMAATALLFVVTQHGLGNTLKAVGIAFLNAGTAHERRVAARRVQVQQAMVQALESAGERA